MDSEQHPLNQILYGPPGTGKTWNTVTRAVAIIEGRKVEKVADEERKDVKSRFEKFRKDGQVAMVTFHQNYAYEDFIQGIRPILDEDGDRGLAYELRSGVFLDLAKEAEKNREDAARKADESWDVDEVLDGFMEWIETRTGKNGPMQVNPPEEWPQILSAKRYESGQNRGEFIVRGSLRPNRAQGVRGRVLKRDYRSFREGGIKKPQDITPIGKSRNKSLGTYKLCFHILEMMKQYHDENWNEFRGDSADRKNYVLILDEINRGNIARIFGELITLVEESRRIGRSDETRVKLPYADDDDEDFGVPENLYLIGTMNTADRSIALLDTALRRRFEFVEMMPWVDHPKISADADGVNVRELLRAMNERIRFLLDRERQIGHTYFLGVDSIESLKKVFQNRIAPLLQEYFYDDWEKMDLVLNRNGFVKKLDVPKEPKKLNDAADTDRKAYELRSFEDKKWNDPERYRKIYSGEAEQNSEDDSGQA